MFQETTVSLFSFALKLLMSLYSLGNIWVFWLVFRVSGASDEARAEFVAKWINAHIEDCKSILGKPLLIAEFGKSSSSVGYTVEARDEYFGTIFNMVYECASKGGSCSGTTFWQVMAEGMENWGDGYQVVLEQSPSTAAVIAQQSKKISSLNS